MGARGPAEEPTEGLVSRIYGPTELASFLGECDYLVSLLPDTPASRGLLDHDALAPCASKQPVLINAGRGSLISEAEITRALDLGYLRHVVADVFMTEPLPASSPLWRHPKVTITTLIATDDADCH